MKISDMLKREDFYSIFQATLNSFCDRNNLKTKVYVYPELNAITTLRPSISVKKYLYTEYSSSGSLVKKTLVWCYTRLCMNSFGLMASHKTFIPFELNDDCLIYPCNKKIRIFDFKQQTVRVILKKGFQPRDIQKEIIFRTNNKASFILPILKHSNQEYTETIIDGVPLARITSEVDNLKKKSMALWHEYVKDTIKCVPADIYAEQLHAQWISFYDQIKDKIDTTTLKNAERVLYDYISSYKGVFETGLSHGDIQPGNIWVENKTKRIYIIDWESYSVRSLWYDKSLLEDGIRNKTKLRTYATIKNIERAVVLYEEMLYRMDEIINMPEQCSKDSLLFTVTIVLDNWNNV